MGQNKKEVKFSTSKKISDIKEFCYTEFKIDPNKSNIRLVKGGTMLDNKKKLGEYTTKDCVLVGYVIPK